MDTYGLRQEKESSGGSKWYLENFPIKVEPYPLTQTRLYFKELFFPRAEMEVLLQYLLWDAMG